MGTTGVVPDAWLVPFDLADEPPVRCFVTPTGTGSMLTLVLHHIAYDGWSERAFFTDLGAAYGQAFAEAAVPKGPVRPVRAWRPSPPGEAARARVRAHWEHTLRQTEPLALPPGAVAGDARFAQRQLALDAGQARALCAHARSSAHFAALAWYGTALHRLTGADRFAVGSYHAGREAVDEHVVGYFVRPVPVVLDFRFGNGPAQVAAAARRDWLAAVGLPPLPLSELAALAPRLSDPWLTPVFQAALIYQNAPAADLVLPGHTVLRRDVPPPAASLPFLTQIWPSSDGSWDVRLECDPTRVAETTLDELSGHLADVLRTAEAAGPRATARTP